MDEFFSSPDLLDDLHIKNLISMVCQMKSKRNAQGFWKEIETKIE
jgi:hypothetical protein